RVSDNGRILDAQGRGLKNYGDTGLPAYLEFEAPGGTAYFTLEVNGTRIHQPLSDQAAVPAATPSIPIPPPLPATPPPPPPTRAAGPRLPRCRRLRPPHRRSRR